MGIGHVGQAVAFIEPAPQIDRPASLAAKRHRERQSWVELILAGGAFHQSRGDYESLLGLSGFFFELLSEDLLSLVFSAGFLSFSAAFL